MLNAVFYGFQFAHHGEHASYIALRKELEKRNVPTVTAIRPKILFKRGFRRLRPYWMKLQERRLFRYYNNDNINAIHYFFPENTIYNGHKWKGEKKLIITCHQPAAESYFQKRGEKYKNGFLDGIRHADVIVLMSLNGIDVYKKYAPQAEVVYIPHGVDTGYFKKICNNKTEQNKTGYKVLTVGNWLRDYKFWARVVNIILNKRNDIKFTVVAGSTAQEEIKQGFNNKLPEHINILSGISDDELRYHYSSSDIMFLPLIDAWANNTVLESSAMGLPVMISNLPAIRDYLGEELPIWIQSDRPEDEAARLENMLSDNKKLEEIGTALMKRVQDGFSWEKIAEQHIELYNKHL